MFEDIGFKDITHELIGTIEYTVLEDSNKYKILYLKHLPNWKLTDWGLIIDNIKDENIKIIIHDQGNNSLPYTLDDLVHAANGPQNILKYYEGLDKILVVSQSAIVRTITRYTGLFLSTINNKVHNKIFTYKTMEDMTIYLKSFIATFQTIAEPVLS